MSQNLEGKSEVELVVRSEFGGGGHVKRCLYSDKLSGHNETVIRGYEGWSVVELGELSPKRTRFVETESIEGTHVLVEKVW